MNLLNEVKLIPLNHHGNDEQGNLVVVEELKDIPFDIKRLFYIYGTNTASLRGLHANKFTSFVLVNVQGSSTITVSDGRTEKLFKLNSPSEALYIPALIWKKMSDFSSDSILLCLASHHYDSSEYISDFSQYQGIMKEGIENV